MFDSETSKSYKSMWKYRKLQSKMDMLRRVISLGVILQLIANIGKHLASITQHDSCRCEHSKTLREMLTKLSNFKFLKLNRKTNLNLRNLRTV